MEETSGVFSEEYLMNAVMEMRKNGVPDSSPLSVERQKSPVLETEEERLTRAKYAFEKWGGSYDEIKLFGDWAVNGDGDIMNYMNMYYALSSDMLENAIQNKETWVKHIGYKAYFDVNHFAEAYDYALPIAKEKVKQVEYESNR